jgi:hypothetical protein
VPNSNSHTIGNTYTHRYGNTNVHGDSAAIARELRRQRSTAVTTTVRIAKMASL